MSWEAWGTPEDPRCEVCGANTDHCVCPECPVCGEIGNPKCYAERDGHGMERTEEQIASAIRNDPDGPDDWLD